MWNQKASFRFEINNFSEKKATTFSSPTFVSGGCEWYVRVYSNDHHLTLGLHVANHELLQSGWKTSADFCFVVLNQSDKELFRSTIGKIPENNFFCAKTPCWGFKETLPLSKFKETESLDKDTLIIDVYIKILQVVDGEGKDVLVENNIVDVNGFQVLASQVTLVRKLFAEHPGFAEDFKPYNQAVKTSYMNVLMKLIKRLEKPIKSLSETRLRKAQNELSDLMSVGFKLNWLKLKLEEVTLEKKVYDNESKVNLLEERVKGLETMESSHMMERLQANLEYVLSEKEKASVDESRVQEIDERVKNLELMELDLKLVSLKTKLDEVYLERKKLDDDYEVRAKQLEESVKNLELVYSLKTNLDDGESRVQELDERNLGLMDLGVKLDSLKKRFEELSLEVEELHDVDDDDDDDDDDDEDDDDDDDSRVQELEERVNDLEMMDLEDRLDSLTKKLDEVSSEMMELHDDDDDSRVQELEERVNSLEMMDLGHKLDSLNTKLEKVSVERKKLDDDNATRAQELDGRVNDLELMDLGVKVDSLNTKLEKASVERKKLDDANAARAQGLYERFDDLDKEFEFKLESLEKKIEKVSVERKELDDENESRFEELEDRVNGHELVCSKLDSLNTKHESRAQGHEERIKGLELMDLGPKVDSLKTKVFGVILGIKKLDVANKSRVQELEGRVSDQELGFSELDSLNTELEERVKSLELMDLGVKLDSLKTKLEEVTLERKKQDDDNASKVRELEERVNGLELVDLGFRQVCLNKVLEEAALERKKSDEANAVRFKRLEEMVLQLKDELDKKKDKSSADGFLLVD